MPSFIEKSIEDGIVQWRINRPERVNALGTTLAKCLNDLLTPLHYQLSQWLASDVREPPVRALVISATPTRRGRNPVWIGGGDLKELATLTDAAQGRTYADSLHRFCAMLEDLPIPVVTLINGAAIGGGAELALAADLRIASRISTFEFRQLRVGLATGYGGATRLVNLLGMSRAQKLLYLGETIDAAHAEALGLVHRIASDDLELVSTCKAVLRDLLACEPRAFAAQKKMFRIAADHATPAAYAAELEQFVQIWMNPSHKKILERFSAPEQSDNSSSTAKSSTGEEG